MIQSPLLGDLAARSAGDPQLVAAALLGIATVVLLITQLRVHPFLALILGSAVLGIVAGMPASKTVDAFTAGVGSTVGSVGLLIALGAMIGALLADSGGADRVVETVATASRRGAAVGDRRRVPSCRLPRFFEVGVGCSSRFIWRSRRIDIPL